MLGEDAANSSVELTKKMLEIIIMLLKYSQERMNRNGVNKKEKPKKVKVGKLNMWDMKQLIKNGEKLRPIPVPAEHINEILKIAQKLGGSAGIMKGIGNNALLSVPESCFAQVEAAIRLVNEKMLTENEGALSVKKSRDEIITPDRKDVVNAVLDFYDVPAYRIDTENGGQLNVIPKEFEKEYRDAMVQAGLLQKEIEGGIDMDVYTPTMPLSEINFDIIPVDKMQAEQLAYMFGDKVEILHEENSFAVKFPLKMSDEVVKFVNDMETQLKAVDLEADIAVIDSNITINKSLIEKETESAYLTRIPNTKGKDYIWIDKNDVTLKDGGKTLQYKLDYDVSYKICDVDGNESRFEKGAELSQKYNTKNVLGNAATKTSEHFSQTLQRIEVYDPTENKLMRISLESSDKVKQLLINKGYSAYVAEMICKSINDKMTDPVMKEKFAYKDVISFGLTHTDNLENAITEAAVAKKIKEAEFKGEQSPFNTEKTLCIYDKKSNTYTLIDANTNAAFNVAAIAEDYSDMKRCAIQTIAERTFDSVQPFVEKVSDLQSFNTGTPELDSFRYSLSGDYAIVTQIEGEGDDAKVNYALLERNSKREEIEKILIEEFAISDLAAAELIKSMIYNTEMSPFVEASKAERVSDNIYVQPLTSKYIAVSKDDTVMNVPINSPKAAEIMNKLGIDQKTADRVIKSIAASVSRGSEKAKNGLNSLIKEAGRKVAEQTQRAVGNVFDEKGKAQEISTLNKTER